MDTDGTTISCPRCATAMLAFERHTPSGGVMVDMCNDCGGVWFDGAEVARVYTPLEALASLATSAPSSGRRPIGQCPRCQDPPRAFSFVDLELDVCPSCKGLWVDGDELIELARAIEAGATLPKAETASYRTSGAEAQRDETVKCKACDFTMSLETAEMTSFGPLCAPCVEAHRKRLFDMQFENYQVPKRSLFADAELPGIRDIMSAMGAVLRVTLGLSADADRRRS